VAGVMAACAAWSTCAHWNMVFAASEKVAWTFVWAGCGRMPEAWERCALVALVGVALWVQVRPAVLRDLTGTAPRCWTRRSLPKGHG
jgi:hypothetical protein